MSVEYKLFKKIKNYISLKLKGSKIQEDKLYTPKEIYVKHISDKGLLYRIHKELLSLNNKIKIDLIKNWAKYSNI